MFVYIDILRHSALLVMVKLKESEKEVQQSLCCDWCYLWNGEHIQIITWQYQDSIVANNVCLLLEDLEHK